MFRRLAAVIGCLAIAGPALAAPAYVLTKSTPLGAPDRWDYVVFDAPTHARPGQVMRQFPAQTRGPSTRSALA